MLYFDHETHTTSIYIGRHLFAADQLSKLFERKPERMGLYGPSKNHQ